MKLFSILFAILAFVLITPNNQATTEITVTISNISTGEGKVLVGLFTQDEFMKKPVQSATATIENGKATVNFKDVTQGTYAVIAHHDANDNGKMDFEATGMPKEDYGTSNNSYSMGPPNWNEAKFEVGELPVTLDIRF